MILFDKHFENDGHILDIVHQVYNRMNDHCNYIVEQVLLVEYLLRIRRKMNAMKELGFLA